MSLINKIINPSGFLYDATQDIFYSKTDAWQHNMGYFALYDKAAPFAGMIIQCEPVKFKYDDRNWNIEFWKGQYGAFTGAEVGVYTGTFKLNTPIIDRTSERLGPNGDTKCADEPDWLQMSFVLKTKNGAVLFRRNSDNPATGSIEKHWWLTGFKLGLERPSELINEITIVFKDEEMLNAFVGGLINLGYSPTQYTINGNSIMVIFDIPQSPQPASWALDSYQLLHSNFVQYFNKVFVGVNYTIEEAGIFIDQYFDISKKGIAKILRELHFGYNEIAKFLQQSLNSGLETIGNAIKFADATKFEIGKALKNCSYSLKKVADFLKEEFELNLRNLAKLLRGLGYSAKNIAKYLKNKGMSFSDLVDLFLDVFEMNLVKIRQILNSIF